MNYGHSLLILLAGFAIIALIGTLAIGFIFLLASVMA